MSELREWLKNLVPGDKVIVSGLHNGRRIKTVTRTTKTQIVIEYENLAGGRFENKFRKEDGYAVGGDQWHPVNLEIYTEEKAQKLRESAERKHIISKVQEMDMTKFSLAKLRKIKELIDQKED